MSSAKTELQSPGVEHRDFEPSWKLCHPPEGEDIVITGMAGKFPNSDDIYHFRDNLFNKVDLISGDFRRWKPIHPEVPQRTGKLNDISRFDAGFFGVRHRHSNTMDPMIRMIHEVTFEAILDSGYHPSELVGTRTGVFIGSGFSEAEKSGLYSQQKKNGHAIIGMTRSMISNYVSYFFGFQAPSVVTDTACSSSMYAIEHAYKSIREGICDMAIVGGAWLCLHPIISLQFARLGVLSADGACKVFDNSANGYVRSETECIVFLQKSKDARRLYAHVVHSKLNCDGYKQQGITFPSTQMQKVLMQEVYSECDVDVTDVTFVEAHGTGTAVGDPEELDAITEVFLRKRKRPLHIGSVKSNAGHNEPSAGVTSIVKILIGMESGYIPPNINFSKPKESVEALVKGRLKVVTEKMPWPDDNVIVGINCFGFGGSNGHLVLRWNEKEKTNGGMPADDLPRLVCASGRTEQALTAIWNDLSGRTLDAEFIKLFHTIFGNNISNHLFRGYQILSKSGELTRSTRQVSKTKPELVWVFSNFSSTWPIVGKQLTSIPLFSEFLKKIQGVLSKEINVNLVDILEGFAQTKPLNQILGTVTVQICLIEVLKALEIEPNSVLGLGIGELIAAYYESRLSLDEVISVSLFCGCTKERDAKINRESFLQGILNNSALVTCFKKWLGLTGESETDWTEYFAHGIPTPSSLAKFKELLSNESAIMVFGEGPKELCLVDESSENHVENLLYNLGRFYERGFDMKLDDLYPKVSWPVSRGTPMISPLIKWNADEKWFVDFYQNESELKSGQRIIHIGPKEADWNFIDGHVIDGRNLLPATAYLTLVWETLAIMTGKLRSDMKIVFENVKFLRAVNLTNNANVEMIISINMGEKKFEITESRTVVVTGKIYELMSIDDLADVCIIASEKSENIETLGHDDIYKELRIRGYNYKGEFKGLREFNINSGVGLLTWTGNWTSFMDNMLQMMILQMDTRNLYVPTSIKQIIIDGPKHTDIISKLDVKEEMLAVYASPNLDIIKSGAIEFRGLKANAIPRRRKGTPVLETYKFIPNVTALPLVQSTRVLIQVMLENNYIMKFKSVELADDSNALSPLLNQALGDLPLIQAETVVLPTDAELDIPNMQIGDNKLSTQTNIVVMILSNAFRDDQVLDDALNVVNESRGYVITREDVNFDISNVKRDDLDVLCVHTVEHECLILFRKKAKFNKPLAIDVSSGFDWLTTAQESVKEGRRLLLYSQNVYTTGILGLVNCLRKEPNDALVSCFYIVDDAPKFEPDNPFYVKQVEKNLAVNVWKMSAWGTYRHLLLEDNSVKQCEHCYANVTVRGDLSSMKYIQGHLHRNYEPYPGKMLVYVYYAALNFRDVMTSTGRIVVETITKNRALQECVQGIEYTGRDVTGNRVMGMVLSGSLATHVEADSNLAWAIPDEWSMEEAITVPVAYGTVIYALLMRAKIKHGQSILIHSATGGVGQAAINIALYYECDIFVTVGTHEKRDYLRKMYPQIQEEHIGNSHDISFEQMIKFHTNGRGVDLILNSLSEEKLLASVRCLARKGHFLEIGKFDMDNDNSLEGALFEREATFHGVMLDAVFLGRAAVKRTLGLCVTELIQKGAVKPLPRTVFKKDEVIDAFKFMVAGKHLGKVLVKIREEEKERVCSVEDQIYEGVPRYYCDDNGTYIILGGLGGFGLQLADWLVMRRAKKLILNSRRGIKTGYQAMMLRLWRSYGTEVIVRTDDITTRIGCTELIKYANSLGPVKGVFNLAVVLKDALFENQSVENFEISFGPKAVATKHLDTVTREMCPELRQFVVFSSVSCGRGNAGQTNYAMANSIMERICEQRKAEGYPALVIQWGAVGDVGLVAEMKGMDTEVAIGGTLQQKISSCLQMLDNFFRQDEVIVGSMVVAEKSALSGADNIVDAVLNIFGFEDLKMISVHTTFPELGMDSMMGVEIKQTLEREYEVFLSAQEIRTMTFAKLQEIAKRELDNTEPSHLNTEEKQLAEGVNQLLHDIADEEFAYKPFVEMGNYDRQNEFGKVYFLPGIGGTATAVAPLMQNLQMNVVCLQYCPNIKMNCMEDLAKALLPYIDSKSKSFVIVAHSFGCALATEIVRLLEMKDCVGKLILIDGSPEMMAQTVKTLFDVSKDDLFETDVLFGYINKYLPPHVTLKHKQEILRCESMKDRIKYCTNIVPDLDISQEYLTAVCVQTYARVKSLIDYVPNYPKLRSKVKLIKPKETFSYANDDYNLSSMFQDTVDVRIFEGNHQSILKNPDVAQVIRNFIAN